MKIQIMPLLITTSLLITGNIQADIFGTGPNQFSIDFVNIGNAGNAADTFTGNGTVNYGAVGYDYRIGKYEVTIDQFTKARAADNRIGDGDENFWNDGTRTVGINAPTISDWFEAAMFCNWLTTGDAYSGAYQFNGSGVLTTVDRAAAVSAYGTVYVLPTEDEWYKAAYYKPMDDGSYSLYASGLDTEPVHGFLNGWNYNNGGPISEFPNLTWIVGSGAEEQAGTYDMMGNEHEWTESSEDGVLDNMGEDRVIRGGHFGDLPEGIGAVGRFTPPPGIEVGFRVAVIPEPSSVLLMMVGAGGLLFHRRARQRVQHNQPPTRRLWK